MGMAPTINRQVARCSALGNLKEAGKLLHTLAVVYWCVAGAIALFILALAPLIASYWLKSKQLSPATISHAVMLMGLVVAFRWPIGLYQGALMGAQRITVSSAINMVMVTISNLGAIAVLAFVSPTIEALFIWQACVGLIHAGAMRLGAWRVIGGLRNIQFDINELKNIWRFSAGMSGLAVLSIILMQLDKVILSKMLDLEDFGRYMLAMTLANGLLILLTPIFNVIYPRLASLVFLRDEEKIIRLYRTGIFFLAAIVFPTTVAIIILAKDILFLWTNNIGLASTVAPILILLIIGTALNGIMIFPYALQLAYGHTKIPLTIVASLIIVYIPLTIFFVMTYGAVGGALAWAILNLIYIIFGTWITHQHLLKEEGFKLLIHDITVPLGASLVLGFIGWKLIYVEGAYLTNVYLISASSIFSMVSIIMIVQGANVKNRWAKYLKDNVELGDA